MDTFVQGSSTAEGTCQLYMTWSLKIVTLITHAEIGTCQHDSGKSPSCG